LLADLLKGESFERTTVRYPGIVDHHIKAIGRPIVALMACSTDASSVTSISTRCKASCSRCANARSSSAAGAFFPAAARIPAKTRYPWRARVSTVRRPSHWYSQ
jgi:hypothetical protein